MTVLIGFPPRGIYQLSTQRRIGRRLAYSDELSRESGGETSVLAAGPVG
jgi:hypothetical protein